MRLSLILVFWSITLASYAQQALKPTTTETLVRLKVYNPDDSPYANQAIKFIAKDGKSYKAKTDKNGAVQILLPINNRYTTQCGDLSNSRPINIKNRSYGVFSAVRYTHRFIDYTFEYKNYDDQAVVNEPISIRSESGKVYEASTQANGHARFYLPIGETYTISVPHRPNLKVIDIEDLGQAATRTGFTFRWHGSVAYEQMERERIASEKRYAEECRIQDSIRATQPTTVIFFAQNADFSNVGFITVYDGGKDGDTIGEISLVWSCTRGPSAKKAEAKIIKMKGTYRYYAKSSKGIEWEGTYEVLGGGTKKVILKITDEHLQKI